jgi:hypothetical protein
MSSPVCWSTHGRSKDVGKGKEEEVRVGQVRSGWFGRLESVLAPPQEAHAAVLVLHRDGDVDHGKVPLEEASSFLICQVDAIVTRCVGTQ